ncbi:MAG TPA: thioredoxin-dependent thiol peroxidase [Bryobacteraceae bacterium]|jgi:peroxiredoxin Q/BCP|nr:thioredoxin-dependent thiol peroxidase [Bryobacteraceae bacterium]
MLQEGDKAPVFKVLTDSGEEFDLAKHQNERIVLYFYPRADTPGCTIESCEFRDTAKKFTKKGVTILGISPDTTKDQLKFKEKFDLNFTLLADADKTIANLYGVMKEKNMYGKKVMGVARTTFVIDNGKIVKIFNGVKPEGHAEEVLATL